jgi:hypothetical protein
MLDLKKKIQLNWFKIIKTLGNEFEIKTNIHPLLLHGP